MQISANNNIQQMQGMEGDSENQEVFFQKKDAVKLDEHNRYNAHYQKAKKSFLKTSEKYYYRQSLANFSIRGYHDEHVRNFIKQIDENESLFRLQNKQFNLINQELLDMFKRLKQGIILHAKENESEYQRILKENYILFKERGRLKRFQAYSSEQKLVNIDLFGLLSKKNFEFERYSHVYRISSLIPNKIIVELCEVPMNYGSFKAYRSIWEQYYYFITETNEISYFDPLIELLVLVHLKRKQTTTLKTKRQQLAFDKQDELQSLFQRPKESIITNQQPFQFKFCEIIILQFQFQDLRRRQQNEQTILKIKMDKILNNRQKASRHLDLRRLLFQHSHSLRSVIQWWNFITQDQEILPEQGEVKKAMHYCNWQFLQQGGLYETYKFKLSLVGSNKKLSLDENLINKTFCRMAFTRIAYLSNILAIHNHIMTKTYQQQPMYVRFFTYSYTKYSKMQRNVDQKDTIMQSEAVCTVFLGVVGHRIAFFATSNEQLSEYGFCQLLSSIMNKFKGRCPNKVFISEFSFSSAGFQEITTRNIFYFFKKRKKSFLMIDVRPTSYFLHFVVDSFIDKYLRSCKLKSEKQFVQAVERYSLQVVKKINENQMKNRLFQSKIMMNK